MGRIETIEGQVRRLNNRAIALLKADPYYPLCTTKRSTASGPWRVGIHHRALAIQVENGVPRFWIGTYAEYDRMTGHGPVQSGNGVFTPLSVTTARIGWNFRGLLLSRSLGIMRPNCSESPKGKRAQARLTRLPPTHSLSTIRSEPLKTTQSHASIRL